MPTLKSDIKKIQEILDTPDYAYQCENPEYYRSKAFCRAFGTMLKHLFPECEIILSNCYCEATGFIKKDDKYIYYASEDYRWPLQGKSIWDSILFRKALNDKDYGGAHSRNNYSNIYNLRANVNKLFEK